MKQYAFKRKEEKNKIPLFYTKLIISVLIFGAVTAFCNLNEEFKEPVRKILYHSYDFDTLSEKSAIYIDKCREVFYEIKNMIDQGE